MVASVCCKNRKEVLHNDADDIDNDDDTNGGDDDNGDMMRMISGSTEF